MIRLSCDQYLDARYMNLSTANILLKGIRELSGALPPPIGYPFRKLSFIPHLQTWNVRVALAHIVITSCLHAV